MKYKLVVRALLITSFLLTSALTQAAVSVTTGKINRILMTGNTQFGGCMVKIDKTTSLGVGCGSGFATLNCAGLGTSPTPKDQVYAMLDNARMSLALGLEVALYVDDSVNINGYCAVKRLDVVK